MRIACIHVPQIALQCATRLDPSLRGSAIAVVGASGRPLHAPVVTACSRAAHALGVRVGMTATIAREHGAAIVTAEPAIERETVRAIADALLAISPCVELGGRIGGAHHALYAEVPAKVRGHAFGAHAVELADQLGITARVGIADDRFTAWVAAAHSDDADVVTVPRGGSPAFLAPRPLALLAITPEVLHMLEALGVRTLGQFAALPAPSVARPVDADYQGLARGDSGTSLRAYAPDAPIREELVASTTGLLARDGEVDGATAVALLAARIALRLAGRGRTAATLELAIGDNPAIAVALHDATADVEPLARALAPAVASAASRVRVTVTGEVVAGGDTIAPAPALAPRAPTLAVVLATPSTVDLFTGAAYAAPPRPHRPRARRGKQRRHPRTLPNQSRLDLAAGEPR